MALMPILFLVTCLLAFIFCVIERVQLTTAENSDKEESALFLTPLLKGNEILKAQQLSRVCPDIANTTSFTGYFTVDQECESNLFFWFFQAQTNWENSPVLLWLQGGPGSSSLFGLFNEIGPLFYEGGIPNLREISWNKNTNLLFIDQPVGTGFSFSNKECYARNKTDVVRNLHSAIKQFFQLFPVFKKNNFYIAGESYAGHYIPYIADFIHKQNPSAKEKINLSGLIIGNGWMDSYYQSDYGDFLYSLGLIDEDDTARYKDIMDLSVLKKAIHVGSYEFNTQETTMKTVFGNLIYDQLVSVKSEVEELLEHYPIVFYFGQLDTVCPYSAALGFLRELRWSGAEVYQQAPRRQWCVGGQLAGFYRSSHNLHEVLVRNAGHSVPLDQPLWALTLADSVTSSPTSDPLQQLTSC